MQTRTWELKSGVAPVSFPGATGSAEKSRPLPCWTDAVSAVWSPVRHTAWGHGCQGCREWAQETVATSPSPGGPEPGGRRAEQQRCLKRPG